MNGKTLGVLALVAILAIGAALVATRKAQAPIVSGPEADRALLVPGFKAALNDIAGVRIVDAEGAIDLQKDEAGTWRAASFNGYPAKAETVAMLLMTMANQEAGEAKTDDPALYAEIGVDEALSSPEAAIATFTSAGGKEIASIVFGVRSQRMIGDRFVRVVGEARAWRVPVRVAVKSAMRNWVDQQITRIPAQAIESIRVEHVDAQAIDLRRPTPESLKLEVVGLSDGLVTNEGEALSQLEGALAWLDFESVRPASGDITDASAVTTTYVLSVGWSVEVLTWREATGTWARITAIGNDAFAEAIRARTAGWDFTIAEPRFQSLRPTMNALTAPAE